MIHKLMALAWLISAIITLYVDVMFIKTLSLWFYVSIICATVWMATESPDGA